MHVLRLIDFWAAHVLCPAVQDTGRVTYLDRSAFSCTA